MKYDVNLYQAEFRRSFKPSASLTLFILVALTLVLIAGVWAYQGSRLEALDTQLAEINATSQEVQDEITELGEQVGSDQEKRRLEKRISVARQGIAIREEYLSAVDQNVAESSFQPVAYLEGVARQVGPDLWLDRIAVDYRPSEIELRGHTLRAAALPKLVADLQQEPPFADRQFRQLSMERNSERPAWIDFRLLTSSSNGEESDDGR